MISNLSRINECHFCEFSAGALRVGCLSCSNPDPHLKMHPYGIQAGSAAYPASFDPKWKLVRCANFSPRSRSCERSAHTEVLIPSGLPFRNATSWRALGFKVFFRFGKVYLFQPLQGLVFSTDVDSGKWMTHVNLQSAPWLNATAEVRGTSLEAEFRLGSHVCYCDSCGPSSCDFCAGRRPVVDPLPTPVRHSAAV